MSQYIITIVPVEDDGEQIAGPVAQTVVRLDTGSGHPVVRELTVRAPENAGLTGELPYVDFDALLRAFVPPQDRDRVRGTVASGRPVADIGPVPAATETAPRPQPPRPAPRAGEPERLSRLKAGRAYRRAPDPAHLEAVYEQVGTISRVAEHFDVPVHTAQGWISRMRRKHSAEVSAT
ncbi:hypothetical protein [Micromonospora globbae]|uniref:Helix-turn-helix domain-containing protein n=1 Tax=Micromonospora globbae TaxID=1894969 RepID=A0ABZ1SAI7_9ACTN|nr:hypothetical protein [Micromonospora globbae]WTF83626.1 hypothetical protein OH732_17860 [Micromonospora globbae]